MTIDSVGAVVGTYDIPESVRLLSSLNDIDYADLFTLTTDADAPPEQWARAMFGDAVRVSPVMIGVQIAGLLALVAGVFLVARAPALADLRPSNLVPPLLNAIPAQSVRHLAVRQETVRHEDVPEAITEPMATTPAPGGQTSRHRASHQE